MRRFVSLVLISLFALPALPAWARKQRPNYHYGEAWWEEYESDENTSLLLHFGKPLRSARKVLATKVAAKRQEEKIDKELGDLDEINDLEDDGMPMDAELPKTLSIEEMKQAPVDDSNVPPGVILDYGPQRRKLKVSAGMELVPEGYYGAGLRFAGKGALKAFELPMGDRGSVEAWIRVPAYPQETATIWSLNNDECQLLLHPDGKLECRLKKPHGVPYEELSPEAVAEILAQDATVISPEPVPLGTWTHVMVYNKVHIVQGTPGPPWEAVLKVNGFDVASYMSRRGNNYRWLGWRMANLVLGNNFAGTAGFTGTVDEVRLSLKNRAIYERPVLSWRDPALQRPVHFNKPYFRQDGTVFHASLDCGKELDLDTAEVGGIAIDLKGQGTAGMHVPGIRGHGWVLDPRISLPRFSLKGMSALNGALEFWLRPVNWDDVTGYWHHTPPRQPMALSVARFYGRDKRDKEIKLFMNATVPRCHNRERSRWPVDPGHWMHMVVGWHDRWLKGGDLFADGKRRARVWRAAEDVIRNIEPLYVEFGISDDVKVKRGEKPLMELDEVVGYDYNLPRDEIAQARQRWQGPLEAIRLYQDRFEFKWSIQRLDYTLTPLLPEGVEAAAASVALLDRQGGDKVVLGPFTMERRVDAKTQAVRFHALMNDGETLPYGAYRFAFQVKDPAGKNVLDQGRDWDYEEEPWRHNTDGILDKPMPPWTPIEVSGTRLATRMSAYTLGEGGLPTQIRADGHDLLAGPIQLLEQGKAMAAGPLRRGAATSTEATWSSTFAGSSCRVEMDCHAEYDGMVKVSLRIKPKGTVQPLQFVIPLKAERARRFLYYPMGARGVRTGVVPETDRTFLASRYDPAPGELWREYRKARQKNPKLRWSEFFAPRRQTLERYNFYGHFDLHDLNRGLWWFCDNAAGWHQSKTVSAIEMERQGDTVKVVLNLIAEPVDYESERPIVFALLPHPARPMVEASRLFNRVSPKVNSWASNIYDCFAAWPKSPRYGGASLNMKLYPAVDPEQPEEGPSWEYAESCIPAMKSNRPHGTRTLYLSKMWFSCRAGAYDNWEWRSGKSGGVSLTPSFVNYLCWEMNEWIGRGIWDAVYLDECYEQPATNLLAGFSVKLPDGSEQPGVTNFQFRELMKRWRGIFVAHGVKPCLMGHHTYSWQYHGLVWTDSVLDGENKPIVSLRSRDWIDSCSKPFFETVQNGRLWGLSTFYMPFIAEGGFHDKDISQFPKWQWRMARQAQSMFAHYETATVYEGQGAFVYHDYWKHFLAWGGGSHETTTFHPYWDNADLLTVAGQGGDTLVSCYTQQGGKVWLVASNRRKEAHTATVELDLKALGLGASPRVKAADGTFDPPPGDDFLDAKARQEQAAAVLAEAEYDPSEGLNDDDDELAGLEDELADPGELQAKAQAAWKIALKGNVLTVPIRPRDYRVVVLE